MNFLTFNPSNLKDSDDLVKFYKTKNVSARYILPMAGLSIFDFKQHFVDAFISMEKYSVYVKCSNPMYSLGHDKNLVHGFHTSTDDGEEFYYLEFEVPEDYHQYFDFFKTNDLRKFDPIANRLLYTAKLVFKTNDDKYSFNLRDEVKKKHIKANEDKQEMIFSLFNPLALSGKDVSKRKIYDIRLKLILELNIMTEEEFFKKVSNNEIDLSQHIDMKKEDIEEQLKIDKWVSKYDFTPSYAY